MTIHRKLLKQWITSSFDERTAGVASSTHVQRKKSMTENDIHKQAS